MKPVCARRLPMGAEGHAHQSHDHAGRASRRCSPTAARMQHATTTSRRFTTTTAWASAPRRRGSSPASGSRSCTPSTRRCSCSGSCGDAGMPTATASPSLLLLLALARDPVASSHRAARPADAARRRTSTAASDRRANRAVGSRLSESTIDKVVRNTASSWTQSGHLKGRGRKVRQP